VNKEKLLRTRAIFFRLFWWVIISIYVFAYLNYLPLDSFGTSNFRYFLYAMPLITGLYVLLKTGDLI